MVMCLELICHGVMDDVYRRVNVLRPTHTVLEMCVLCATQECYRRVYIITHPTPLRLCVCGTRCFINVHCATRMVSTNGVCVHTWRLVRELHSARNPSPILVQLPNGAKHKDCTSRAPRRKSLRHPPKCCPGNLRSIDALLWWNVASDMLTIVAVLGNASTWYCRRQPPASHP